MPDELESASEAPETPIVEPGIPETAPLPEDRPPQNVVGEFNRKIGDVNRKLDAALGWIASQQAPPARPASPGTSAPPTDDELFTRAQQGDRDAFEIWTNRRAARVVQAAQAQQQAQMLVDNQIGAILGKYPVLRDTSHPLSQWAAAAHQALLQQGYPNSRATLLEAMKTAITDRPDLVSELHAAPAAGRETARRSAAGQAQTGMMGASHRAAPAPGRQRQLSQAELDLAKRHGVKDAAGALKRFTERQNNGQVTFGSVAAFVPQTEDW